MQISSRSLGLLTLIGVIIIAWGVVSQNKAMPSADPSIASQPDKTNQSNVALDFDMQQKCAQASQAYFDRNKTDSMTYENHWNSSLNKCFIITMDWEPKNNNEIEWIIDAVEGKSYGSFIGNMNGQGNVVCWEGELGAGHDSERTRCYSLKEWAQYTDSLMNG